MTIDIHVTRESVSNDPTEEPVHLSEAFEGVLEALPGHMRRERRRSMAMQMEMDDNDDDDDESPVNQAQERRPFLRSADSFLTPEQEVRYTKRGDRHGISDEVWRLIRWNSGRAQLKGYAQQDVSGSVGDMGMIGMFSSYRLLSSPDDQSVDRRSYLTTRRRRSEKLIRLEGSGKANRQLITTGTLLVGETHCFLRLIVFVQNGSRTADLCSIYYVLVLDSVYIRKTIVLDPSSVCPVLSAKCRVPL